MAEHVFHNTKLIDKSNELNHGIKASKELIIFN